MVRTLLVEVGGEPYAFPLAYIVRTLRLSKQQIEVLEGQWSPRMIVLEFESLDDVRSWYHSDDYQECLPMRLRSAKGRMIAVEGYAP